MPPELIQNFSPDFAPPYAWAAVYRALGLQVIPGWRPGEGPGSWKRPKLAEWRTFQEELVGDAVFDRWYRPDGEHASRSNMGLITGKCSGAFILDLDTYKDPFAGKWWHSLIEVENAGLELETPTQITGGGGRQMLFRYPSHWRPPTIRTPVGIDIRGEGGFAVLPPSIHETGREYAWLTGMAPWEIDILEAPDWLLHELDVLAEEYGGSESRPAASNERTASPGSDLDPFGKRQDGREDYMTRTVWANVIDWYRACPIYPPEHTWTERSQAAYEGYERNVVSRLSGVDKTQALDREGRGPRAFHGKFKAAMRRWDGKVAEEAAKPRPGGETVKSYGQNHSRFGMGFIHTAEEQAKAQPGNLYEFLNVRQIKATPDPKWLILTIMPEKALGFIYGPPGGLKTFIALDIGLSLATRQGAWWKRDIRRNGAVIYISSEGLGGLKFRIMAWEAHRKINADDAPFYLIKQTINFMQPADVGKLLATVAAIKELAQVEIAAVFVDTVSRVLPGSDENLQKDMTIFVAACDAVRQRFDATVIGIHHTNKEGGFRGSSVMPGAGDFMLEVRREPGAMTGSLFAKKIKDAEDGWEQFFKVEKIILDSISGHSSLVIDPVEDRPKDDMPWLPSRDVCRQILAAIDEEWSRGRPWCYAKNTSRCAEVNISRRWNRERATVTRLLEHWVANGVIIEDVADRENHITGYRKMMDL